MKKIINSISVIALLALFLLASACSHDSKGDALQLLKTVPSTASMVVYIDLEKMADKAGDAISASKQFADIKDMSKTAAILFADGTEVYFTGLLDNPDGFKTTMAEGDPFTETDGFDHNSTVAIKGNQFWVAMAGTIRTDALVRYTRLDEQNSFTKHKYCDKLLDDDYDMSYIADFSAVQKLIGGNDAQISMLMPLVMSAVFDKAQYAVGGTKFDDGKSHTEIAVLNADLKPAKFLLPMEKISPDVVKAIGGNAAAIVAGSIGKDLVAKIKDMAGVLGGMLPGDAQSILDTLDGTIAAALNDQHQLTALVVSTTGQGNTALSPIFSQLGVSMQRDGKLAIGRSPLTPNGTLIVDKQASAFKDAYFGIVTDGIPGETSTDKKVSSFTLMIEPSHGSIKIESDITLTDKKENSLKALIQYLK